MAPTRKEIKQRVAQLERQVPIRGMEQYPSLLKGLSYLPSELESTTLSGFIEGEEILDIISFPSQIQRGHYYVPKQALLFTSASLIHTIASIWPDHEPKITKLRGEDISCVNLSLILLYGYLEIFSGSGSSLTRICVEFNTVAWEVLSSPLRRFLQANKESIYSTIDHTPFSLNVQDAISKLPLRFINGLKLYTILPGEELEDLVFQPGVWKRWLVFLRKATIPGTLLVLTSNYFVILREELDGPYGWFFNFIPRRRIFGVENTPYDKWNDFRVQINQGDDEMEIKFQLNDDATKAWQACWITHCG